MRIKSVNIINFGPFKNVLVNDLSPEINIFFGKNDSGKSFFTEAICAIIKKKLKTKYLALRTTPETGIIGAITIEHKGMEITLQGDKNQQQNKKADMNTQEIETVREEENLLLNIHPLFQNIEIKDKISVFNSICTKLFDDKSKQLQTLQKKIKELGGLTDTKNEKNQIISKIEQKFKYIQDQIEELKKYYQENDLESIQNNLILQYQQKQTFQAHLEEFKKKKNAFIFKEGKNLITQIDEVQKQLGNYTNINQELLQLWTKNRQFIEQYTQDAEKLHNEIQTLETDINNIQIQLEEKLKKHEKSKIEQSFIDRNLHIIHTLAKNHQFAEQFKKFPKYLFIAFGLSFLLTLLFPITYLITRDQAMLSLSIPIVILTIIILAFHAASTLFLKKTADTEADLRAQFIQCFQTEEKTFDDLLLSNQLYSFLISRKNQTEEITKNYYSLQATLERLKDNLSQNNKRHAELTQKINTLKKEIAEIMQTTGTETHEQLNQKIQERTRLENEFNILITQLTAFSQSYLDYFEKYKIDSLIRISTEKIKNLKSFEPYYDTSFRPNASEENKIRDSIDQTNTIIQSLESKKKLTETKFDSIYRLILEIVNSIQSLNDSMKLSLDIDSFIEFKYIKNGEKDIINTIPFVKQTIDICKTLMDTIERETSNAERALEILNEIQQEEQERKNAFLIQSNFPSFFNQIAGIQLTNIEAKTNPKSQEFLCLNYNICSGTMNVSENQLGSGSTHQLYMCLSLMIMDKVHEKDPCFLILDNPFLGADDDRAKRMVEVLEEFRKKGWQLLITVNTERDFNNCINGFPNANIKKYEINNFNISLTQ